MSQKKYIKDQKLRELSVAELSGRVRELKAQEYQNRFDRATGRLENYREILKTRRRLAVLMTLMREQQLKVEGDK